MVISHEDGICVAMCSHVAFEKQHENTDTSPIPFSAMGRPQLREEIHSPSLMRVHSYWVVHVIRNSVSSLHTINIVQV